MVYRVNNSLPIPKAVTTSRDAEGIPAGAIRKESVLGDVWKWQTSRVEAGELLQPDPHLKKMYGSLELKREL